MTALESRNARHKYARYLRATGRPTRVPVGPARQHLRTLYFGYGMSSTLLAKRCDMAQSTISEIILGRRNNRGVMVPVKEIYREKEASILAIKPESPTTKGGALILGIGSTRRLQALVAAGYPVKWLADQIGNQSSNFSDLVKGKQKRVQYSTAHRVRELFEKYETADPLDTGIPVANFRKARTVAIRNGYVGAMLWDWDTIDDPDGFPNWTGYCGSPTGYQHHVNQGLPVCQPCRDAKAVAQAAWRKRHG